jgi:peptidyl-prolyl cis-trans isomerase C
MLLHRSPRLRACALRLALLIGTGALSAHGDGEVVARVGVASIGASELGGRARQLADFQLTELGSSWPEQRRRLLADVWIRDALLEQAAERDKLADDPLVGWQKQELLAGALLSSLMQRALASVTDTELAAHYTAHAADYSTPRSIELWHLLVADEASAKALLERARSLDVGGWSQLVREHSLDEATRMRSGSLGFVRADGHTNRSDVRVPAALFAAADKVPDGQLVPTPVPEGERFAVVWRRRSRPVEVQKLERVRDSLRAQLAEQRVAAESARLVSELRGARLGEYHPELLEGLALEDAPIRPRPESPGVAVRSVDPKPRLSERGLR